MHPDFARRVVVTAALVATVFVVLPSEASGRRRAVAPPTAGGQLTAPEINGTVLDDVTNSPVVGLRVRAGNRTDTTDSAGAFKIKNITSYHGVIVIETLRSGYAPKTQNLTTGGTQTVNIRVQPLPTVRVRKVNNTSFDLDFDSLEFGYPVVFSGYNAATYDEFCKPSGTKVTIDRADIRKITGPATMVGQASCCSERNVLKVNAELKTGETTDLFFMDTCSGIPSIDLIGRNHVTGKIEYTPFTQVAEITFP
ncbi:MAG TPA: hypothetical protein VGQ76_13760 [Thermoanaerobaculia bacterium]|jgi:hypothetical protein|nr:hypothetical protein [Thermoanaerobaculia bacterium]